MHIIAFLVVILRANLSTACFMGRGTEYHGKVGNSLVSNFKGCLDQILTPSQATMDFLTLTKQTAGSVHNQVVATPAKFLPFHCLQILPFEATQAGLLAASLNN